ncbi:S8 family peptidase [Nostoc sp. UHCC 0302]|uniref:S8 family peptidase n=1 Tax=Nostoc sp. UHCC 0302 TaxID=3134896 RepID=UPI00311C94C8
MIRNDVNKSLLSNQELNATPISSSDIFTQNDYSLGVRSSSYNSDDADVQMLKSSKTSDVTTTATSTGNYNSTNGYGLVNAGAAVAEAAGKNTFADVPNLGGNNWGADLVNAPEAWANGYTGKGVVVAVVDTGVDYTHEDLKNNIWTNSKEIAGNGIDDDGNGYVDDQYGWNFANNNNSTLDKEGHGTHVAGTIAGENNDYGVTGIAYDAKIMPVKVLDDSGSGTSSSVAKGIRYAADNGANVINLSLGSRYSNSTLESAIKYASSKGAIVVMAAGNNGGSSPEYPAKYANQSGIAVGAVDKNNQIADFSNRSGTDKITYVTAPGVDVYSTVPDNQYATLSGTSMATPHVAGVVALMLSANPTLTDAQVRQIIADTAGNSTSSTTSSLNSGNVNSLVDQTISQPIGHSTPSTTSSLNSGNVNSLVNQTISQSREYSTPSATSSLYTISTSKVSQPFRYYQDVLDSNSISYGYDTDGENILNQTKKQLKNY